MDSMTLWKISWAIGAAVVLVVAVLLLTIIAYAKSIDRRAGEIWTVGKQIAANTVSIWMLQKTNVVVGEILKTVKQVAAQAGSIDRKLAEQSEHGA